AGGVGLAALVFATGLAVRGRAAAAASIGWWLRLAAIAIVSGTLIGWTVANGPLESLTIGDWLRSLARAAVALMAPPLRAPPPPLPRWHGERARGASPKSSAAPPTARATWWCFRSALS